jgi:cell division protein FtsB
MTSTSTLPSSPVIPGPLPERPSSVSTPDPNASQTILLEIRTMLMRLMPLVDIPAAPEGKGMLVLLYNVLLEATRRLDRSELERETIATELRAAQAALEQLTAELTNSRQDLASLRAEVASLTEQAASTHRMIREMHGIFTTGLPPSEGG